MAEQVTEEPEMVLSETAELAMGPVMVLSGMALPVTERQVTELQEMEVLAVLQ